MTTTDITVHITENEIRVFIAIISFFLGAICWSAWESFRKSTFGG